MSGIHGPMVIRISFVGYFSSSDRTVRSDNYCWSWFGPIIDTIFWWFWSSPKVSDQVILVFEKYLVTVEVERFLSLDFGLSIPGSQIVDRSDPWLRSRWISNLINRQITITGHITWFLFSFLFLRRSFEVDFISRKGLIRITVRHAG